MRTQGDGFRLDLSDIMTSTHGKTLYRVIATKPLLDGTVPAGSLGGYVESIFNLSDDSWVDSTSQITENVVAIYRSFVGSYSWLSDDSQIYNGATIRDSTLRGKSLVGAGSVVSDSHLEGLANIEDNTSVYNSWLSGKIFIMRGSCVVNSSLLTEKGGAITALDNCNIESSRIYSCKPGIYLPSQKTFRKAMLTH